MANYPLGTIDAFRSFDVGDIANSTDSLLADSNSIENAILASVITSTKDFFMAKDGIVGKMLSYAYFEYDFDTDGGAVGEIDLRGTPIPAGAVVLPGHVIMETDFTSGGSATVAIGSAKTDSTTIDADGFLTATAYGSFFTNGYKVTVADDLTGTTDSDIIATITVATAALTAGKFVLLLPYVVPSVSTTTVTYS